ncbi:hypothetical protein ABFX02_01G025700 [Erythranthe guttata]
MVSFSNGSLSGVVSNKRPLENGYLPKFKPRRVSAVRDFPPLCGSNAVPTNLKPDENGGSVVGVTETVGVKDSQMNDAAVGNGVVISEIADQTEAEAVGNSETDKIEADGFTTAEMPQPVKLNEMENSDVQNLADSSGFESSNIKVDCQSNEEINCTVDVDMTESLDALVERVTASANFFDELMIEIGPLGFQLPNEAVNNPIEEERTESMNALVGNVETTVMDVFSKNFDELITETAFIGVDTPINMESDSSNAGCQKELNEVGGLALVPSSVVEEAKPISYPDTSHDEDPSVKPTDKYRLRRVSAIRDFPPHCGRNVTLPIDEEKQTVKEYLDTVQEIHVKEDTTETLNGGAVRGPLELIAEATVECVIVDSEELIEKKEARQSVPRPGDTSKAGEDTTISNAGGPVGREIAAKSPDTYGEESGFSMENEVHREVVYGLMAAPYCPWRNPKVSTNNSDGKTRRLKVRHSKKSRIHKSKGVAVDSNLKADGSGGPSPKKTASPDSHDVDGSAGSSTFMNEKDRSVKRPLQITPIAMFNPWPDNSDNNSAGPVKNETVVYSPGGSDDMMPPHNVASAADEVDGEVVGGVVKENAGSSHGKKKQILPWRQKGKAVARKSTPKVKFSGSPFRKKQHKVRTSDDVDEGPGSSKSSTSRKSRDFEIDLPPIAPPSGRKSSGQGDARNRVRETLRLFHAICRKCLQHEEANTVPGQEGKKSKQSEKKLIRIDLHAAKIVIAEGRDVNTGRQILGQVPGVEVGDEFQYRVELALVGIHRLYQAGIDSIKLDNGVPVAVSIVSSGSYADDVENADTLIYSGQGGNVVVQAKQKSKEPEDQKLEKGNLALKNSITTQTPVRVVRGWKETKVVDLADQRAKIVTTYVYDGLYTVTNYWTETGPHGKQVFMFELKRNPGQPELAWKELKKSSKSKIRAGVCVADISGGKEALAISAVNTCDSDKPPNFNYISKMMYPNWHRSIPPAGCDCIGRCSDSRKCRCAVKNGGEIPYNRNGALVETKPLVYECGPHCKCPPSCYNRVGQRGIKFRLEIFKTESRGWGVRPLTSIPSGSFICEYVGELLEDKEAERRVGSDEYLFDIGQNYSDCPSLKPEEQHSEESGYTIDAAHYGNVGRFINHSCSPNLYAQNVIHDHDDRKMPHVMLFAMENIPPLQELTYHYNYSVGQISDPNGNIKVKKCYCGTAACTGRMY